MSSNILNHRKNMEKVIISCDDIDIQSFIPSHHTKLFDLKTVVCKLWINWKNITETLYYEDTKTILRERPIFDIEKNNLIKLDSIIESHMRSGTFRKIKVDKSLIEKYKSININEKTNQKQWNKEAHKANLIIDNIIDILLKEKDLEYSMTITNIIYNKKANNKLHYLNKIFLSIIIITFIIIIIIIYFNISP